MTFTSLSFVLAVSIEEYQPAECRVRNHKTEGMVEPLNEASLSSAKFAWLILCSPAPMFPSDVCS